METLMQPDPMKETVLPLHQSIPFHIPLIPDEISDEFS